jgi:uncharacterized protein YggT (Ycf19 family)
VSSRPLGTLFGIIMNVLIIVAVLITMRLAIEFFGQLAAQEWGRAIVAVTNPLVIPFGFESIKTPYGGAFDVSAGLTILVVLVAEWILEGVRGRA